MRGLQRPAGRLAAAHHADLLAHPGHVRGEPVDLAQGDVDGRAGGGGQLRGRQAFPSRRGHGADVEVGGAQVEQAGVHPLQPAGAFVEQVLVEPDQRAGLEHRGRRDPRLRDPSLEEQLTQQLGVAAVFSELEK